MDALFNVFGFGMQKPDEKWKFFENQKNRNIEQQEEKKRGIFWRDKKNQHKGISNLDMGCQIQHTTLAFFLVLL